VIERIEHAGDTFVSVGDGVDLSTDTGRLIMRIMLAMGEWQLDRVRAAGTTRVPSPSRAAYSSTTKRRRLPTRIGSARVAPAAFISAVPGPRRQHGLGRGAG